MGYYINPKNTAKEDWLEENGVSFSNIAPPVYDCKINDETHLAVCLMLNPGFSAAGIAYDQAELERFAQPCGRPKLWCFVKKSLLKEFM